ncbi:hypothetical protein NHX12_013922, partial [Muraenolepis orangiensis]
DASRAEPIPAVVIAPPERRRSVLAEARENMHTAPGAGRITHQKGRCRTTYQSVAQGTRLTRHLNQTGGGNAPLLAIHDPWDDPIPHPSQHPTLFGVLAWDNHTIASFPGLVCLSCPPLCPT